MKKIVVEKNKSGNRIDKFLKEEVFLNMETTRGEIIRNIKAEQILVNGKKIKPSYLLKENDEIEINILKKLTRITPNKNVIFEIIHEDESLIVLNKPAGLQVHPSTKGEPDTLVEGLLYRFPEIKKVGDAPKVRPGIVHRLDRDTSGIMLVAKNQKTFLELKDKFKNHEIEKVYWAIVYGHFSQKKGLIEKPLAKSTDYKKQIIAGEKTKTKVRSALTEYEVLKKIGKFSLLKVSLKTGRTHQIRIHLSSIGHPIVGDEKYKLKSIERNTAIQKQLLHAKHLAFSLFGKKHSYTAQLPEDFNRFLTKEQ